MEPIENKPLTKMLDLKLNVGEKKTFRFDTI